MTGTNDGRRTTRRDVLSKAAAVAAGAAAATIASGSPAEAANGDPLTLGNPNASTSETTWDGPSGGRALHITSGQYGIRVSTTSHAIHGETTGSGASGVLGLSEDDNGIGIYGQSDGTSLVDSVGTLGRADTGIGLKGWTQSGIAILALAESGGKALDVQGPSTFSRSGRATVGAGKKSVKVSGQTIATSTMVLAVLQQSRPGVWVTAAVPSPSTDTLTIYLNKAVGKKTKVAWFLLG
jgi:hypothetical protein